MSNDLSIINLIANADFVIKIVMLVLLLGSVFSWSVMFEKWSAIKKQLKNVIDFEGLLLSGSALERISIRLQEQKDNIIANVFLIGMQVHTKIAETESTQDKIGDKLKQSMRMEQHRLFNKLERNVDLLATIGSTAPFVGLLGTVWGIMHSFQAISISNNSNLSTVAPSIAEALLATAAGLFVSIPAIVFYNRITVKLQHLSDQLINAMMKIEDAILNK